MAHMHASCVYVYTCCYTHAAKMRFVLRKQLKRVLPPTLHGSSCSTTSLSIFGATSRSAFSYWTSYCFIPCRNGAQRPLRELPVSLCDTWFWRAVFAYVASLDFAHFMALWWGYMLSASRLCTLHGPVAGYMLSALTVHKARRVRPLAAFPLQGINRRY